MLERRDCLTVGPIMAAFGFLSMPAHAQAVDKANAFVKQTGEEMVGIVNGTQAAPEKRRALTQILDAAVDVDGIARFCLGRFLRTASPDQQKRYVAAFHDVLVTNIASKLGEYRGVKLAVVRGRQQDDDAIVTTIVERPNNAPTTVDWVIGQPASSPKIIDVIAEGTSLRLTQRQDYASYLSHNNNDVDALIKAMLQQTAQNS
jgi:phospholipid transport system substrate-binding protein